MVLVSLDLCQHPLYSMGNKLFEGCWQRSRGTKDHMLVDRMIMEIIYLLSQQKVQKYAGT